MTTSIVETRHGRMRVIDDDPWISRALIDLGEFSEDEYLFLHMILQTMSIGRSRLELVEAGPYIGDLTIPLSRIVDKIYAFEPQAKVRDILLENLEMNNVTNVEVYPYAIGDQNGTVRYHTIPETQLHSYGGNQMAGEGDAEAIMVTLDSLNLSPNLIKADIEGMEPHLLAGGVETLQRTRCPLFMEFETVMQADGTPQLPEILATCGYTVFPHYFPIYRQFNWKKNTINTFGSTVSKMLYAVPPFSSTTTT